MEGLMGELMGELMGSTEEGGTMGRTAKEGTGKRADRGEGGRPTSRLVWHAQSG